jgi:methylated-DNA-protein-cysteine methyltransferase related protein
MTAFTARVHAAVRRIPPGCVASYGGIAALLGTPRAARGVGWALAALAEDSDVPWWRVINAAGRVSLHPHRHGAALQRALLEGEGVRFDDQDRVDWRNFGWLPEAAD